MSAPRTSPSIAIDPDRIVYCCERRTHFILAYRLYGWKNEDMADRGGVGFPLDGCRIHF
jgi:hypothetical protein